MQFRQFTESLKDAGWEATTDAQYQHIFILWKMLFPAEYRISQLEAEVADLENELEGFRVAAATKAKYILG